MLRIQNDQDVTQMFPDFLLSDISNLFLPIDDSNCSLRIDSNSIGEKEYASIIDEYFDPGVF